MENAVAEIGRAAGIEHHGVGGVVRVGRVHAHEHALDRVGVIAALAVADVPQVGRLHEQDAVFVELEAGRGSSGRR